MSNRFTREAIDKGILKLLCYHAVNTPTILVINKLDLLKKDKDFRKSFYRVIEKLTCGHINGEPTRGDRVNENPSSSYTVDRYLKRKFKVSISNIQVLNQYIAGCKIFNFYNRNKRKI